MTIPRALVLILLLPCVLVAQTLHHSLIAHTGDARTAPLAPLRATLNVRVLAVMVQFQPDTDTRTTGTGQFDTSHVTSGDIPIDAPPRNASYFEDHLTFLRHYFHKASKGKVVISTTLIPEVLTLPKVMSAYAPVKSGPTTPVAFLAYETWRMVDSLNLVPGSLAAYDAFVLFHAGAGHDIDMVSLLGYDPTDRDLPSLYFGASAFLAAFGTQSGIPLKDGGVIPNTLVLPETESRTVGTVGGDALLEYGINGLLCASFGNYLGLPDLFDTKTGATGIGRFGLMDGQGFFSFNGVFPPEPSAWEKYWLGWVEPIVVSSGSTTLQLPAVAIADSIYRISIGPREYYLVENRNRDPQRNGQTVAMTYNGSSTTLTFDRDTTAFNFYDVTALKGNITDVEDLDWSLPGGVDDTLFYDGGILIWHVDERIIAANIGTNAVNADADHRGIDLEEADGSQDIGHSYGSLSAASGSEIGTALDFWYAGNESPINTNEFSTHTLPSTLSNDGAETHITLTNFSARGPRMTVKALLGDSAISPMHGFPKYLNQELTSPGLVVGRLAANSPQTVFVTTLTDSIAPVLPGNHLPGSATARVYGWRTDGSPVLAGGGQDGLVTEFAAQTGCTPGPLLTDLNADGEADLFVGGDFSGPGYIGLALTGPPPASLLSIDLGVATAVSPAVNDSMIVLCGPNGRVNLYGLTGGLLKSHMVLGDSTARVTGLSGLLGTILHTVIATGSDGSVTFIPDPRRLPDLGIARYTVGHPIAGPASSGIFDDAAQAAVTTTDGLVYLFTPAFKVSNGFPVKAGDRIAMPPAIGDINGDGLRDIVVFSANRILAYNPSGILLDGFPVTLSTDDSLVSAPIIGDVNGDETIDVIGVTDQGLVVAHDGHGRQVPGFPLAAGQGQQTAAMFTSADSVFLVVASSGTGSVSGWLTGRTNGTAKAANYPWPQYQHDAQHRGTDASTAAAAVPLSNEFFPKSRAYNWPNPVYDRTTRIRYYVNDEARVHVKIFDLAGDLVTEFDGPGIAGRDNEVAWDVSSVQSGVYLARIEATGSSQSGTQVIKIAVVK